MKTHSFDPTIIASTVGLLLGASPALGQAFEPKVPRLDTRWTEEVPLDNPRGEYPRPHMTRPDWASLNGIWEFGPADAGEQPPGPEQLGERIRVPFPIQSALSGIMRTEPRSWYRRTFQVPNEWAGRRILLHFGAVNHEATVYLNGQKLGVHRGSYDNFSFDITDRLATSGDNELVVGVFDPGFLGGQPVGKQFVSGGILFTASSGIWQSVWLEPVPVSHVTRLDQTPDLSSGTLRVTVRAEAAGPSQTVVLRAKDGDTIVGTATGAPDTEVALPVPNAVLWTPENPFLYDLEVELREGEEILDEVQSYFGMRSIGLAEVGGATRMVLNGDFVFQMGALDQGYWPDGLYTAPTDEALRYDIELAKGIGLNMLRKHVKVEDARWYYWADKLGILVWQDMPNMGIYLPVTEAAKAQFELELAEMIDQLRSHPSIVMWVPFNEGWGQYDVERVSASVKARDPSRILNANSGAANCCQAIEPSATEIFDGHLYRGPWAPPPDDTRASVNSEFGTCDGIVEGHVWFPSQEAFTPSREAQEGSLRQQWAATTQQVRSPGLSGAVYVELYDIEQELAGFYTYDREVDKCDAALLKELNEALITASRTRDGVTPQPGAIPEGAVAYWSFDEGAGDVAEDGSGNGYDLVLEGATWAEDGVRGGALSVAGMGEHAVAAGSVVDTGGSFTIAAWLRHEDKNQTASAVSQRGASGLGFQLGLRNGDERPDLVPAYQQFPPDPEQYPPWRWTFNVPDREGCLDAECGARANSSYGDFGRGLLPQAGEWQHVIGVMDRSNSALSLYVDGKHVSTEQADYMWDASGAFTVGIGNPNDPVDSFRGSIDELRVYNRALTASEAYELYAAEAGVGGPDGGCGCTVPGQGTTSGTRQHWAGVLLVWGMLLLRRRWQLSSGGKSVRGSGSFQPSSARRQPRRRRGGA
jgi:hypothetical protein